MIYNISFYTKTYNILVIKMISYLKSSLYTLGILLISTIIITVLNYFNILSGTPLKILYFIIPILSIAIGSYILGKNTNIKGITTGLIYSSIWSIILLIINIFLKQLDLTSIIYFIIIILLSMFFSILGKNKKKM